MNSDYIFVSYAHKDKRPVLREIAKREKLGQKFWYDKNISAGQDWAEIIGKNLEGASSVLYFDSKKSRKSENCRRELAFAKEHSIPVETIKIKSRIWIIIVAAAAATGAAAILFVNSFSGIVPDVVGEEAHSGKTSIEESGFDCSTAYGYSSEYPLGYVMEQDKTGKNFSFAPVTITQSLGKEEKLVLMPDTVGSYISDGIGLLADAGLTKFTITAEPLDENEFGFITNQSAPAGYMISSEKIINLSVAKDENILQFEYNGHTFTIEDGVTFDLNNPENSGLSDAEDDGLTDAELALFNENNKHTIKNPEDYENVWLPAQNETVINENPDSCYGWVIVRDTEIDAEDLFNGYSEIYVCPGITVTIKNKLTDRNGNTDFYVAQGGTLIFEDDVEGGLSLVNDGTTIFRKNVSGGADGVLIANRGTVEVAGSINKGTDVWSFYGSSITGTDNTGGTLHDYSAIRQMDASGWYVGCSGADGVSEIIDKLEVFAEYDHNQVGEYGAFNIAPVIKPEDYEDHYMEAWYTSAFLFFCDYDLNHTRHGEGMYYQVIAAPGVTLTVSAEVCSQRLVSEKGSTIIINTSFTKYHPSFIIDGTLILNGDNIPNSEKDVVYVANRGNFIINGNFGGEGAFLYNFKGSSCTGNILDGTYAANIDYVPEYITYGNHEGSAYNYDKEVLLQQGYRFKFDYLDNN